jgi:outer membrane protein OmpA-like peptidoglycan-associated protein
MLNTEKTSEMTSSFVDLMTSLAVIFILLFCASLNNAHEDGQTTRNSVLAEMQKKLTDFVAAGIEVKSDARDPLGLLILVPEDLLAFKLDKADISTAGERFLTAFIPRLARIVCSPQFSNEINSIIVEGHTDSSGTARHNWDLSQKRSMSVVRASLNILDQDGTREQKAAFLQFLSASGRGSADLITGASGEENPSLSRRVIFKLRFRSIEQKPLLEAFNTEGGRYAASPKR